MEDPKLVTTTVRLPHETWSKVRRLAEAEVLQRGGGRPSLSRTIEALVNRAVDPREGR